MVEATKTLITKPDPTINVQNLLKEAVKRIDDLRFAETLRVNERIDGEKDHVREIMTLRSGYERELTIAEAKRIDAIRVVDVQAVSVASDKAAQQATVLATQVSTSAETLRALVASSATATAAQLTQIITPITDRLALLEKAQYTGAGKEGVTDPAMAELTKSVKDLVGSRSQGASSAWAVIVTVASVSLTVVMIVLRIFGK